jgi:hypothetical protein
MAFLTSPHPGDAKDSLHSRRRLFQGDLNIIAKIVSIFTDRSSTRSASAATEEDIENVSKTTDISESSEPARTTALTVHAVVTELIVHPALLGIAQDGVRFVEFLELLFCGIVVPVYIRMILASQAPIRLFDLFGRCLTRDFQYFVIISLT